ncbi:M10 family metallopeptidase C-terminal domain-containing protein [Pseudomonas sp. B22129]|uniref:M10 family metallopeptidase C-terminal domain-containing protein n=1 Tax=Pseudomonas sp. B22129 TaxID=3235111 RepID=UPI003783C0FB
MRPNDPHISRANRQSFDKQRAVEQLTRGTTTWQDSNRNNKTEISYTFNYYRGREFNAEQKQEARRSIESWSDVANLTFTENGPQTEGRLTFRIHDNLPGAADAMPPYEYNSESVGGDTRYNPQYVQRHHITHEVGHTLGLKHPGDYNGRPDDNKRIYAQDSKAHSIMSYFGAENSGKRIAEWSKAPMMDDISAIQHKYGANYQTRREDNTYGFNSNSRRDYYSLRDYRDAATFCVWDGAGNDTLDFSGYGNNQVINLNAGSFSDVGHGLGNVSIARGVTIENAVGGSGNDVLIGNEVSNRLIGGAGGDQLQGGGGPDVFVYNHASDSTPQNPDEIMDFTSGSDKIDVSGALRNAHVAALSFVSTWSGKAGEARLTYDENSGTGFVSIDLTGAGKADLLIKTHGRVKPQDIVPFHNTKPAPNRAPPSIAPSITRRVDTVAARPQFIFNKASDSSASNARLLTDFTTGIDQIDLRGVEREAKTRLFPVNEFTGHAGETIVSYNPRTYRYFIAIDLTGNRRTDFLVKSTHVIKPKDVLVN